MYHSTTFGRQKGTRFEGLVGVGCCRVEDVGWRNAIVQSGSYTGGYNVGCFIGSDQVGRNTLLIWSSGEIDSRELHTRFDVTASMELKYWYPVILRPEQDGDQVNFLT